MQTRYLSELIGRVRWGASAGGKGRSAERRGQGQENVVTGAARGCRRSAADGNLTVAVVCPVVAKIYQWGDRSSQFSYLLCPFKHFHAYPSLHI